MTIIIPEWLMWLTIYAAGVVSGAIGTVVYAASWSRRQKHRSTTQQNR